MAGEYERSLSQSAPSLGLDAGVDGVRIGALKDVRLTMAAHRAPQSPLAPASYSSQTRKQASPR
jgi:hypothetical protein